VNGGGCIAKDLLLREKRIEEAYGVRRIAGKDDLSGRRD